MICTIEGQVIDNTVRKDKDGNDVPVAIMYSGKELVEVKGYSVPHTELGLVKLVDCEVRLRNFDGRSYLSIVKLED